jgi:K(+)-stimulated pyrophosphate-energized sodium pump
MAGLDPEVRRRTDQLDAVGNTTAAIGKGFAIGSAALTAMALLAAYLEEIRLVLGELRGLSGLVVDGTMIPIARMTVENFVSYYNVHLFNPAVLVGIFSGVAPAVFFSALTMSAVGRAAGGMVDEVRRQFREIPGILTGEAKPDYARCVEISTKAAQREMIGPSLLAIIVPVLIGVVFGVAGVLGLLVGTLGAGFSLAIMMSNAGGAWDNAKKYIESGEHGGKGSDAHKSAVVGDTVGDPYKDTSGPSLNILIKLMSMVSVVFAGLIVAFGNGQGLLMMLLGR